MNRGRAYTLLEPTNRGREACPRCGSDGHNRSCPSCQARAGGRPAGESKRRGRGWTTSPYRKPRRNRRKR